MPHWHSLMLWRQVAVDMRVVCPQDVKNLLVKQTEKWAATHECEELKKGVWLEPNQAMSRRKTIGSRTDKHRNVLRKRIPQQSLQSVLLLCWFLSGLGGMGA